MIYLTAIIALTLLILFFCGALNKGANADALSEQHQRLREREAERALGIGGGAFTFQHDRSDTDA